MNMVHLLKEAVVGPVYLERFERWMPNTSNSSCFESRVISLSFYGKLYKPGLCCGK